MSIKYWNGSAFVDATFVRYWSGSGWVDATTAKYWNGTAWVDFFVGGGGGGSLAVTADKVGVSAYSQGAASVKALTTPPITVTATGGTGTITYQWTQISGDSGIIINSPSGPSTTFSATLTKWSTRVGGFRCTVTRGAEVRTVDVSADFTYDGTGVPP